jgi:hypothetical protein
MAIPTTAIGLHLRGSPFFNPAALKKKFAGPFKKKANLSPQALLQVELYFTHDRGLLGKPTIFDGAEKAA